MPKGSCLRSTLDERLGEDWTVTDDLLALLVEVSSVAASDRKLKKPITVPRPSDMKKKAPEQQAAGEQDAAFKKGVSVLAATTRAVRG
jgi:hypothetical protein